MRLSVVATLYRSAPYLQEFHRRVSAAARAITPDYEIILVNDGSPDESQTLAEGLCVADDHVKLIELSRNFGHHKAMMTGLAHARGKLVFLIDSDLEEEPELLGRFHEELRRSAADVVYGVQHARKGRWVERFTGSLFYWLVNLLSTCPIPRNPITARLMTRRYVRSLVRHRDHEIFMAGLWAVTGFRQVPMSVHKRCKPDSAYSFRSKLAIAVNAITSFSNRPLVHIFYLGCAILLLSGSAGMYMILRKLFFGDVLAGWASLIVSIWFLGGLTLFCLGIVATYLSKVFSETKRRPYTVIRKRYGRWQRGKSTDDIREHRKAG